MSGEGSPARRLAFTTMGTPDLDHVGAIALARRLGFQGVDLRCAEQKGELDPAAGPAVLGAIARDFEEAGLIIPSLLCYHALRTSTPDWSDGWAAHVRDHLEVARRVGARAIRVFGVHADGTAERGRWLGASAEALASVLAADESGVDILLQNHLGSFSTAEVVRLAERLDDPRLGLVFAPDHAHAHERGPVVDVLEWASPWIREVYVADLVRHGERWKPVLPGEGEVPLREMVNRLEAACFAGFWSFKWEKIWHADLPGPEEAFPRFLAFMHSLGAR